VRGARARTPRARAERASRRSLSKADPAAAQAALDTLIALVGPTFDAFRVRHAAQTPPRGWRTPGAPRAACQADAMPAPRLTQMAEIYPSLLRQAPSMCAFEVRLRNKVASLTRCGSARSTRDMYAKVQAFYGSDDVRETVFLRPDLLHGSTAKLMVEWAADRDEREKRKPKKKKKPAKAAAAKEASDSDSDEDEDDFDDDDVIDIDDSDEEDTPEEVAQAAQEATAAARRAAEAFQEMGLPAPRCALQPHHAYSTRQAG
jgi:hypothetical protein